MERTSACQSFSNKRLCKVPDVLRNKSFWTRSGSIRIRVHVFCFTKLANSIHKCCRVSTFLVVLCVYLLDLLNHSLFLCIAPRKTQCVYVYKPCSRKICPHTIYENGVGKTMAICYMEDPVRFTEHALPYTQKCIVCLCFMVNRFSRYVIHNVLKIISS